ncbi:lamin-B3-like [Watersipora subatra]|uniref:lamin-B3-like n=1 Tax=Watersipora subatra TaxID=2589382 RepID=UPI00355BB992
MEYSPLNNVSSSGEEVEQFSLPAVVATQYNRPKRRRKRKDFDSIRAHDIHNMTSNSCCRLGTCFLASLIVVLISVTCGLAVMLFLMSRTVTQIQEKVDNLQLAKEMASSSISTLQNQLDTLNEQLVLVESSVRNDSKQLNSVRVRVNGLESSVQRITTQLASVLSNSGGNEGVQKEVAKAGSEILAIKDDIEGFKRRNDGFDKEFTELKTLVNTTVLAGFQNGHEQTDGNLVMRLDDFEEIQKGILDQNASMEALAVRVKSLEDSGCSDLFQTLVHRVDILETYMRDIQQEVEGVLTKSFEDRVFNLTAYAGIEDIISRVINVKTSSLDQKSQDALDMAKDLRGQVKDLQKLLNSLQFSPSESTSVTTSLLTPPSKPLTLQTTPSKPLTLQTTPSKPLTLQTTLFKPITSLVGFTSRPGSDYQTDLTTKAVAPVSTEDTLSRVDSDSSFRVNMSSSDLAAIIANPLNSSSTKSGF